MSNTAKSLVGLVIALGMSSLGWVLETGLENLGQLADVQTGAAFGLVVLGVVSAWFTRTYGDAKKAK